MEGFPIIRNLNRRDCPPDRSLVSVDLTSFEISATGGRKRFAFGRCDRYFDLKNTLVDKI